MAELADAAHAAAEHGAEGQTVQEYITHHLSYLTYGKFPDGHWGLAHTPEEAVSMGANRRSTGNNESDSRPACDEFSRAEAAHTIQ